MLPSRFVPPVKMKGITLAALALPALSAAAAASHSTRNEKAKYFGKRQDAVVYPAPVMNYTIITSPSGSSIRYKEPGKAGVCETTPGVSNTNHSHNEYSLMLLL